MPHSFPRGFLSWTGQPCAATCAAEGHSEGNTNDTSLIRGTDLPGGFGCRGGRKRGGGGRELEVQEEVTGGGGGRGRWEVGER